MFGTRLVPSVNLEEPTETDLKLNQDSARKAVDDMLRAKEEFGIGIGTLISYPLCLLGDLEKYKDFVGRGCPAQSGIRMSLNADGTAHACTHEEEGYGNILEEGIKPVFQRMRKWHNGSYLFEGCAECEYIDVCGNYGLRFSIDGVKKQTYEKIRFGGKWEILIKNLNLAKKKLLPAGYEFHINLYDFHINLYDFKYIYLKFI